MIITNCISETAILIINMFRRCRDRGYKWKFETEESDLPIHNCLDNQI